MHSTPVKQSGRIVSWLVVVVFGISGMVEMINGALKSHRGLVLYGLGSLMIAGAFVLSALGFPSLRTDRARVLRLVLGFSGLALATCGFVMKYRDIS